MEMKLIFSLIETGALPASFLGITNLSFLFYSPPRCKSKVIQYLCKFTAFPAFCHAFAQESTNLSARPQIFENWRHFHFSFFAELFSFSKDEFTRVLHDGRSDVFAVEKTSPLSILIYLYILIFCAGVVAGVVAVPIAPRRYIRPIFRTIPAPNIVAPYLWIKYSIAECTRIKCVAVCLH